MVIVPSFKAGQLFGELALIAEIVGEAQQLRALAQFGSVQSGSPSPSSSIPLAQFSGPLVLIQSDFWNTISSISSYVIKFKNLCSSC